MIRREIRDREVESGPGLISGGITPAKHRSREVDLLTLLPIQVDV
jgi:hypothetical protein